MSIKAHCTALGMILAGIFGVQQVCPPAKVHHHHKKVHHHHKKVHHRKFKEDDAFKPVNYRWVIVNTPKQAA